MQKQGWLKLSVTIGLMLLCAAAAVAELPEVKRINLIELEALQAQENIQFIDTRTATEWRRSPDKVLGAMRVTNQTELDRLKQEVPLDTVIVAYCTCPDEGSSLALAQILINNGYTRAYALQGGYQAWKAAGLPVERK